MKPARRRGRANPPGRLSRSGGVAADYLRAVPDTPTQPPMRGPRLVPSATSPGGCILCSLIALGRVYEMGYVGPGWMGGPGLPVRWGPAGSRSSLVSLLGRVVCGEDLAKGRVGEGNVLATRDHTRSRPATWDPCAPRWHVASPSRVRGRARDWFVLLMSSSSSSP